eukprot:1517980-Pleurochrysis_carterae.AAC.2
MVCILFSLLNWTPGESRSWFVSDGHAPARKFYANYARREDPRPVERRKETDSILTRMELYRPVDFRRLCLTIGTIQSHEGLRACVWLHRASPLGTYAEAALADVAHQLHVSKLDAAKVEHALLRQRLARALELTHL